ncbi:hypothetical protein B7P43_G02941 [Cryptotermes secundus]|uniref:Lipocalin/cytosolic fatty-acid binding domain-containing protein n=1 Tax=Cryptotermes secundus TaxID=105785 RepID=A0A2J7Q0Z2_9NEOP|nr:apolipoprotein D [Cryptotermes secundus]PNF22244.1 hypothetical protein B7P43_G02941 [Cryptotermes secundus]
MCGLWLLTLLSSALIVTAQLPSFWGCPEKNIPMPDFDLSRFLGVWYEILRVPTLMEVGASCVKNNYTQTADGKIHVENELKPLGQPKRVIPGELKIAGKASEGKITIRYKVPILPAWETTYHVLNTDYDSYAVLWNCASYGIMNIQSAWLLARQRKPPGTVLQKAYGVLDAYSLPRNYFVETSHNDCEIAAVAPDVIPSNPVPDDATRKPSISDNKDPVKEQPIVPSDDKSKKTTDAKKSTQDISEGAESLYKDEVPKPSSDTTQENKASSKSIAAPEKINIPSSMMAEIPSEINEEKL